MTSISKKESFIVKVLRIKLKAFVISLIITLFLCLGIFKILSFKKTSRTINPNYYCKEAIDLYESSRDYPFIKQFLIPYLLPELNSSKDLKILDAGCGVGLWSIYAAKNGATVYGIDIQPGMIELAKKAAKINDLSLKLIFNVGDVTKMSFVNENFDKAISINVACNLNKKLFVKHFTELRRVMQNNGQIIFSIPTSHEILFTNNENSEKIKNNINLILKNLETNPSDEKIIETLNSFDGILSGTFMVKNKRLQLVTNKNQLSEGEKIWRKLPNITIPNYYYSEKFIKKNIKKSNLKIIKVLRPKFDTEQNWKKHNNLIERNAEKLGKEYINHHTFIIYYLQPI